MRDLGAPGNGMFHRKLDGLVYKVVSGLRLVQLVDGSLRESNW